MPRSSWEGEFADGQTAALRTVSVLFDGQFLLIRDPAGNEITRWEVRRASIESANDPSGLHVVYPAEPNALLALRGEGLLEELDRIGLRPAHASVVGGRRFFLGLAWVMGIVGAVGLIWMGVTPLSRALAQRVPLEFERALNGSVENAFEKLYCESEEAGGVLAILVGRVAGVDHQLPAVHVLNVEGPNAFALPGGGIVFTRGLLTTAEHPDEVAGILAHEIQHVRQRHVMTSMIRGTLLTTLWAVTVGDYSGLMVIDPATAFQIATLEFSREDEASADRGALEMLGAARISRSGLSDFFSRMAEEGGEGAQWLSSHPASSDRARAALAPATSGEGILRPSLSDAQWQILVRACDEFEEPPPDLEGLVF